MSERFIMIVSRWVEFDQNRNILAYHNVVPIQIDGENYYNYDAVADKIVPHKNGYGIVLETIRDNDTVTRLDIRFRK